ncbi:MAG: protein phosphatase [Bradymonadia bacterium]
MLMGLKLTFVPLSDVGRERSENQDAFGSSSLAGLDFYIVCDGMGGHRGGSTASRIGIARVEEFLAASDLPIAERMVASLEEANNAIFARSQRERELSGMGTTAVLLAVDHSDGRAYYGHVGDSRLYRVRANEIRQLTRDHTFVQRLVDDGILDAEAAESHPQSNVIIRSLGGQAEAEVEVGDTPLHLEDGDVFLICSDGLHGLVGEQEMATIIATLPLDEAARRLIARANEEGGHDNITVELILVGERTDPVPDEFIHLRPTPAPGTRLAIQAEEAAAEQAPDEETAEGGSRSESPTETGVHRPQQQGNNLGAIVVVVVVIAIILVGAALFAAVRSSPYASTVGPPRGNDVAAEQVPLAAEGSAAQDGSGSE